MAARVGPVLLRHDRAAGGWLGAVSVSLLLVTLVAAARIAYAKGAVAALPALLLLVLAVHRLGHHPAWTTADVLAAFVALVVVDRRRPHASATVRLPQVAP
jgi:hypothetical protein